MESANSEGKALLETDYLVFRGEFRLKILLNEIDSVMSEDGLLKVNWPDGSASFELGAASSKWADKIQNPKSRFEKLGVKAGCRVSIVNLRDGDFESEVSQHTGNVVRGKPQKRVTRFSTGSNAKTS